MELQLKKIQHHEKLSEETNCYSAVVYLDGKPVCDVSNHGTGGPDDQHWIKPEKRADIEAHLKANPPQHWLDYDWPGDVPAYDLEAWCGDQVSEWLITKDYRRASRSSVLFTTPALKGIRQMKWRGSREKVGARHFQVVREKYPEATILNELPESEAVDIYRRAA